MADCAELIIAPCRGCMLHVVSFLKRDGRAVITCGKCGEVIFDRELGEETERFIQNQRSYYAMGAEVMPEFAALELPGQGTPIAAEAVDATK